LIDLLKNELIRYTKFLSVLRDTEKLSDGIYKIIFCPKLALFRMLPQDILSESITSLFISL